MKLILLNLALSCLISAPLQSAESITTGLLTPEAARKPKDEADLRTWLENMVWYHHYTNAEISAATGLSQEQVAENLKRLQILESNRPAQSKTKVLVLPYPGGRHPRIGFLDGAVNPHRETKFSVFTPWDSSSYVVVDVPEAIFCQHGLLYLAHTHLPNQTMWDKQNIQLEPLEWQRNNDGTLECERKLPNGVSFGTKVTPKAGVVEMELWLTNGSKEKLSDLRVQNCVMFKGAKGFEAQTNSNKIIEKSVVACKSADGKRWILTAWQECNRPWVNPPCPCMHSDPKFPDCAPGETQRVKGWLTFHEGDDVKAAMEKLRMMVEAKFEAK